MQGRAEDIDNDAIPEVSVEETLKESVDQILEQSESN